MTFKETVKLLCILAGYENNFSFETWCTDDVTCKGYDVYTEDDNKHCINVSAAMGSIDLLKMLLDEIKEKPHHKPPYWVIGVPYKVLLDDDYRKIRKELDKENEKHCQETSKLEKPIYDWIKENNPCPNCKINKKDHWDEIHYNCESFHTMRCPILKEFLENQTKKIKEVTNTPEFKNSKQSIIKNKMNYKNNYMHFMKKFRKNDN